MWGRIVRRGGGRGRIRDDEGGRLRRVASTRVGVCGVLLLAFAGIALAISGLPRTFAQDAGAPADEAAPATSPRKAEHRHHPKPVARKKAETPAATTPEAPAAQTQPAATPAANIFDAQLVKAGATTCAPIVSQLAAASMEGVTNVGTASNWNNQAPDKRPVTLLLGQRYRPGGVLNGATTVIAAPEPGGKCDAYSVQVVPSPLPCAKLRETMAKTGRQIGDLSGVALMQDAASETMLVPTAANTCVLVGLRGVYAK